MPYNLNHVHLKSNDPEKTAQWWVNAFNFELVANTTPPFARGDGQRELQLGCRTGIQHNKTDALVA